MPHCPPERCCSISSASEPSERLRQKRKPISHDAEELVEVHRRADGAGKQPDHADDERPLLEAAECRNVAGRE